MRTLVTLACMLVLLLPQTVVAGSDESDRSDDGAENPDDLQVDVEVDGSEYGVETPDKVEELVQTCREEIKRLAEDLTPNGVRLLGECVEQIMGKVCMIGGLWEPTRVAGIVHGTVASLEQKAVVLAVKVVVDYDRGTFILPLTLKVAGVECNSPGSYGWAWMVGEPNVPTGVARWLTTTP